MAENNDFYEKILCYELTFNFPCNYTVLYKVLLILHLSQRIQQGGYCCGGKERVNEQFDALL